MILSQRESINFDELIAQAKTASDKLEAAISVQRTRTIAFLCFSIVMLAIGVLGVSYQILHGGNIFLLPGEYVKYYTWFFVSISVIAIILLVLAIISLLKLQESYVNAKLTKERIQIAIGKAEQLASIVHE